VSTSLSPEEIKAAAETHRELSPEYKDAVIESFIERVGREIDARVDSRIAAQQKSLQHARQPRTMWFHLASIGMGIPLSGIALGLSPGAQLSGLTIIWIAIAVINVAYAVSSASPRR
jgi:hypothetical protein